MAALAKSTPATEPALGALRTQILSLIMESLADPWGLMSPSIYDTARAALLPAGLQPKGALPYLLKEQKTDGSWGGPGVYAVVPTLAATSTMLQLFARWQLGQDKSFDAQMSQILPAAQRGMGYLQRALPCMLPDTIAVEYIVPMLCEEIEQACGSLQLNIFSRYHLPHDPRELGQLHRLRKAVKYAPRQLVFSLEVLGQDIVGWGSIGDLSHGVGTSPAATAAMLTHCELSERERSGAVAYLFSLARRLNGALPNAAPIDLFDRAWSCYTAAKAGIGLESIASLVVAGLKPQLGERGSSYGSDGPVESDDTSVNLLSLYAAGDYVSPAALLHYEQDDHFACFLHERNPSMSCNAHVLEAFTTYLQAHPEEHALYQPRCEKITGYLLDHQYREGFWQDKWHSSAYYTTFCCVTALEKVKGPAAAQAIARALAWLRQTQLEGGGWGSWQSTPEETAYAVFTLALLGPNDRATIAALRAGVAFLELHQDDPAIPLWHGKELYAPLRVVNVMVLSAIYAGRRRLSDGTVPAS